MSDVQSLAADTYVEQKDATVQAQNILGAENICLQSNFCTLEAAVKTLRTFAAERKDIRDRIMHRAIFALENHQAEIRTWKQQADSLITESELYDNATRTLLIALGAKECRVEGCPILYIEDSEGYPGVCDGHAELSKGYEADEREADAADDKIVRLGAGR